MEHTVKRVILGSGLTSFLLLTGCHWVAQDDYYQSNHSGGSVQQVPQAYPSAPSVPMMKPAPMRIPPAAPPAPSAIYSPRPHSPMALVPPPAPGVPIVPQAYQYSPSAAGPQAWGQTGINWQSAMTTSPLPQLPVAPMAELPELSMPDAISTPQKSPVNPFAISPVKTPQAVASILPEKIQEEVVVIETEPVQAVESEISAPQLLDIADTSDAAPLPSIVPRR